MAIIASICIPYIRKENINRLMRLCKLNAGIPAEDFEIIAAEDTERIGCPMMLKTLVEKANGAAIVFIGDDTEPQPGFIKLALATMALLPDGWGLVGFNDRTGRNLPTHWLADRRMLPQLGGEFFHTGYSHCFCDNELMERAQKMGRFIYAYNAVVLHRHPMLHGSGGQWDADYRRVYSKAVFMKDQALFVERRELWK